jgi:hypothetical protein
MTARTFSVTVTAPPATGYTPTHYVTANATGAGNGSIGSPWTLQQAMTNAVAGNRVRVAAGIYSATRGTSWTTAFYPRNSGTALNPIVFYAETPAATNRSTPAAFSELRVSNPTALPSGSGVLGSSVEGGNASHVVFDGFYARRTHAPPYSSKGAFSTNGVSGIKYRRIYYDYEGSTLDDDNYCAFFVQGSSDVSIEDCYITGNYGSGNHNGSCITFYYCPNFTVRNNEFYNFNCGVYVKVAYGTPQYGEISYNRFEQSSHFAMSLKDSSSQGVSIHHNLSVRASAFEIDNGGSTVSNSFFAYNNTFAGASSLGSLVRYENLAQYSGSSSFYNNICMDNSGTVTNMWLRNDGQTETFSTHFARYTLLDYNVYFDSNGAATFNDATSRNFTGYRSQLTGYPAAVREANSVESPVTFVSASDYRLAANGQAALTRSNVGGPVGCYVTGSEEIGPRTSPSYT